MDKLYICHTYYHVFITLIKVIQSSEKCDIVLANTIQEYRQLKINIEKEAIFNRIFIFNEKDIETPQLEKFHYFKYIKSFKKNIEPFIIKDIYKYNDIYIYNDWTNLGYALNIYKVKYSLIEDGLNCYINFHPKIYRYKGIKKYILKNINWPMPFGQSKWIKSIEVNCKKDLKIKHKHIVEVPRNVLVSNLKEKEKEIIYNIFMKHKQVKIDKEDNKKILVLTQPLYEDKLLNSIEDQIEVYKRIVEKYSDKNQQVIIKPHPRDQVNYNEVFREVVVLDPLLPIEVFNLGENSLNIDVGITISSSALEGINFIKEKIYLGLEWLK